MACGALKQNASSWSTARKSDPNMTKTPGNPGVFFLILIFTGRVPAAVFPDSIGDFCPDLKHGSHGPSADQAQQKEDRERFQRRTAEYLPLDLLPCILRQNGQDPTDYSRPCKRGYRNFWQEGTLSKGSDVALPSQVTHAVRK